MQLIVERAAVNALKRASAVGRLPESGFQTQRDEIFKQFIMTPADWLSIHEHAGRGQMLYSNIRDYRVAVAVASTTDVVLRVSYVGVWRSSVRAYTHTNVVHKWPKYNVSIERSDDAKLYAV